MRNLYAACTNSLVTRNLYRKVRNKVVGFVTLDLTRRTSLIFVLIFSTIALFDSMIVRFSSFTGGEPPVLVNIAIFVMFCTIFAAGSILLINSVRKLLSRFEYKLMPFDPRYFYYIICITLISISIVILMIILQLTLLNNYSLTLLRVQTYVTHLSALFFLSFLIFLFVRWLSQRRNYVVILYCVSLALLSVSLIISLIYLDSDFSSLPSSNVRPLPMILYVINFPGSPLTESLSTAFDLLSLSSFLLMWIATAILLNQYRHRMGGLKYFSVISIPLIYYIFPFQSYFGDALFPLLVSSPVIFSIVYILIFSATKQVGAIFFGLTFWFASGLVYDDRARRSLLVSSIGITILFGSISLTPLQYAVYPPYGLITEAFIPLGSYLLLVGIFTSAIHISRDAVVRKELYKSAMSQLDLLRNIGISEMEKEFEVKVKQLEEVYRISEIADRSYQAEQIETESVKKILQDVLNINQHRHPLLLVII
jgi:hypothetical protein